ncbi:MAG: hypothetical protein H0X02_08075 [Nitrosomonas sp.]|nr:hypothetical protein [Nitrosomonas sp.]
MSLSTLDEVRMLLSILQLKVQSQQMHLMSVIESQRIEIEQLKAEKKAPTPWKRSTQPSPKVSVKKDKAGMARNLKLNLSRVNQNDVIELKKQIRESLSAIDKELTVGSPSDNTTSGTYTTLELQEMLDSLLNMPTYKW